jgi:hypothetical protein
MNEQIPLYLGIPLAILCIGVGLAFFAMVIYAIVEQYRDRRT